MSGFYKYFKENMEALGLAAPESLFGMLKTAIGTAATILSQIDKYGPRVWLFFATSDLDMSKQFVYIDQ